MDLQGAFEKIGDFIKFQVFSSGIPTEQAMLRKAKTPQKITRKVDFSEPRLYNAPSLDTVEIPRNNCEFGSVCPI